MKTITINVTKRDIERGEAESYNCPIYHAAKRKLPHIECVRLREIITRRNKSYSLPEIAQNFIYDFDEGKPVKPIKFPVRVP